MELPGAAGTVGEGEMVRETTRHIANMDKNNSVPAGRSKKPNNDFVRWRWMEGNKESKLTIFGYK
jgi:hypothetical protein